MTEKKLQPVAIDFETGPILPRPEYPPMPVGVAIKYPGKKSRYYAFGHPTANNCTMEEAKKAIALAYEWADGLLMHNAKFDLDVSAAHMGLKIPAWQKIHDSMLLLFLDNPNAPKLGLKPSAERLLNMPPEEQDSVKDWLLGHQDELRSSGLLLEDVNLSISDRVKPSKLTNSPQYWAAWICLAPGALVGTYAEGDVIRTEKLFNLLHEKTLKRKMGEAYDRERKLIPILLHIEAQGIRLGHDRLRADVEMYGRILGKLEAWMKKKAGLPADFNFNADQRLILALADRGILDLNKLGMTPKSSDEKPKYKADKDSMNEAITDLAYAGVLQYRAQLMTCLNTFMTPWLKTCDKSGGLIFTQWNQIRNEKSGARTGRFSSSPNFQNVPKQFKPIFKHDIKQADIIAHASMTPDEQIEAGRLRKLYQKLPKAPFDLPPLPLCREYFIPMHDDHVLLDRDYSQQEPRIFGHFEGGPLRDAYNENPWLDLHDHAQAEIERLTGNKYERKAVKTIDLGLLYGKGVKLLAAEINDTEDVARQLKRAVLTIFPGLADMNKDMRERSKNNEPLRTWGGREYYCEEPKIVDGRLMTFDYKMVNALIQGSAADCTKQALIDYWETKSEEVYLLLTVHDEVLISAPSFMIDEAMEELRLAMEKDNFDVPMLSEGTIGMNWSDMKIFDKKGIKK